MELARGTVEQPECGAFGGEYGEGREHEHISGDAEGHGGDVAVVEESFAEDGGVEGELHAEDDDGDDEGTDEHVAVAPQQVEVLADDPGEGGGEAAAEARLRYSTG